jgi:hypothetical protein
MGSLSTLPESGYSGYSGYTEPNLLRLLGNCSRSPGALSETNRVHRVQAMAEIIEFPLPGTLSLATDLRARLETALGRYAPGARRAQETGLGEPMTIPDLIARYVAIRSQLQQDARHRKAQISALLDFQAILIKNIVHTICHKGLFMALGACGSGWPPASSALASAPCPGPQPVPSLFLRASEARSRPMSFKTGPRGARSKIGQPGRLQLLSEKGSLGGSSRASARPAWASARPAWAMAIPAPGLPALGQLGPALGLFRSALGQLGPWRSRLPWASERNFFCAPRCAPSARSPKPCSRRFGQCSRSAAL